MPSIQDDVDLDNHYWSLLKSTQGPYYPGFLNHLSQQVGSKRKDGRAAVIRFEDNSKPLVRRFKSPGKVREYLDESLKSSTTVRQIFVLEGLPRDFIQVLGGRLKVPPSFFSAHWINPDCSFGDLLNRTPRHHNNSNQFQISFTKLHRAQIETRPEDDSDPRYWTESSIRRHLSRSTIFGDLDGPLTSVERVSFWSTPLLDTTKNKSWHGKNDSLTVPVHRYN